MSRKREFLKLYPADISPEAKEFIQKEILWANEHLKKRDRVFWYINTGIRPYLQLGRHKAESAHIVQMHLLRSRKTQLNHYYAMHIPAIDGFTGFNKNLNISMVIDIFEKYEQDFLQYGSKDKLIPVNNEDKSVVDCGGDFHWVLLNRNSDNREGAAMGHCGNRGSEDPTERILSLRKLIKDRKKQYWVPYLTFILGKDGSLGEMKGPFNHKPEAEHHDKILKLLESPLVTKIVGGGYNESANFHPIDLGKDLFLKHKDLLREKLSEDTWENLFNFFKHGPKRYIEELLNGSGSYKAQHLTNVTSGEVSKTFKVRHFTHTEGIILDGIVKLIKEDKVLGQELMLEIYAKNSYQIPYEDFCNRHSPRSGKTYDDYISNRRRLQSYPALRRLLKDYPMVAEEMVYGATFDTACPQSYAEALDVLFGKSTRNKEKESLLLRQLLLGRSPGGDWLRTKLLLLGNFPLLLLNIPEIYACREKDAHVGLEYLTQIISATSSEIKLKALFAHIYPYPELKVYFCYHVLGLYLKKVLKSTYLKNETDWEGLDLVFRFFSEACEDEGLREIFFETFAQAKQANWDCTPLVNELESYFQSIDLKSRPTTLNKDEEGETLTYSGRAAGKTTRMEQDFRESLLHPTYKAVLGYSHKIFHREIIAKLSVHNYFPNYLGSVSKLAGIKGAPVYMRTNNDGFKTVAGISDELLEELRTPMVRTCDVFIPQEILFPQEMLSELKG